MDAGSAQEIVDRLIRYEIGPIQAADELAASGEFGVGMNLDAVEPEQRTRFQAMLGRLTWHALRRTGVSGVIEPRTTDDCIALFKAQLESIDEHLRHK